MSVSQEVPSRERRSSISLVAAPVPSVTLLLAGAPVWLTAPVVLISTLAVLHPVQFVVLRFLLGATGASDDDAREWAFRVIFYKNSPDPTLKAVERRVPASSQTTSSAKLLSFDGDRRGEQHG